MRKPVSVPLAGTGTDFPADKKTQVCCVQTWKLFEILCRDADLAVRADVDSPFRRGGGPADGGIFFKSFRQPPAISGQRDRVHGESLTGGTTSGHPGGHPRSKGVQAPVNTRSSSVQTTVTTRTQPIRSRRQANVRRQSSCSVARKRALKRHASAAL